MAAKPCCQAAVVCMFRRTWRHYDCSQCTGRHQSWRALAIHTTVLFTRAVKPAFLMPFPRVARAYLR